MSGSCFGSKPTSSTDPPPDGTPVGQTVRPCPTRNFVIILGGPGKYHAEDPNHDQYWGNYFVAAQHVFGVARQFPPATSLLQEECVHWLVYENAYRKRWDADKKSNLAFLKEHAADYPAGFLARVQGYVKELGSRHKYIGIDSYQDIWETLSKLPDKSLTRMYYIGHGTGAGFFMRWENPDVHGAEPTQSNEFVAHSLIDQYKVWLTRKARPEDAQVSKFYACFTDAWANKWHSVTQLKSEGAKQKITFQNVRSNDALSKLESDNSPGWTRY